MAAGLAAAPLVAAPRAAAAPRPAGAPLPLAAGAPRAAGVEAAGCAEDAFAFSFAAAASCFSFHHLCSKTLGQQLNHEGLFKFLRNNNTAGMFSTIMTGCDGHCVEWLLNNDGGCNS